MKDEDDEVDDSLDEEDEGVLCSDDSSEDCQAEDEAVDVDDERELDEDVVDEEVDFSAVSLEESSVEPLFMAPFCRSLVVAGGNGIFRTLMGV